MEPLAVFWCCYLALHFSCEGLKKAIDKCEQNNSELLNDGDEFKIREKQEKKYKNHYKVKPKKVKIKDGDK